MSVKRVNSGAERISADRLVASVAYDAESGAIVWRARPENHFKSSRSWKVWNSSRSGRPAFNTKTMNGYLKGSFDGSELLAHRVAWLVISGEWPAEDVDHVDGDRTNNSARNLRAVSRAENLRNKGFRGNAAGAIGVYLHKASGLYTARIYVNGKGKSLGYFKSLGEAKNARLAGERVNGYHENHGRPI